RADRVAGDRGADVDHADVRADEGREHHVVSEFARGPLRGGVWIFVRYGGGADQRAAGEFVESGERDEHCDVDGDVRDIFCGGVDGAELCGAGVDYWRSGVYGGGDCGSDVAGFEDGLSGGVYAGEAAVGIAGGRDGVDDCDRGDAEFDEHGLAEIYPDADSGKREGIAAGG